MENRVARAEELVRKNGGAYCKFLSANDSGENGTHQSGILISNKPMGMFVTPEEVAANSVNKKPVKKPVRIIWPDGSENDSVYTFYHSKKEGRITSFGKGFRYRGRDLQELCLS